MIFDFLQYLKKTVIRVSICKKSFTYLESLEKKSVESFFIYILANFDFSDILKVILIIVFILNKIVPHISKFVYYIVRKKFLLFTF